MVMGFMESQPMVSYYPFVKEIFDILQILFVCTQYAKELNELILR